jgi:hypothetical protein
MTRTIRYFNRCIEIEVVRDLPPELLPLYSKWERPEDVMKRKQAQKASPAPARKAK